VSEFCIQTPDPGNLYCPRALVRVIIVQHCRCTPIQVFIVQFVVNNGNLHVSLVLNLRQAVALSELERVTFV